MVQAHASTCGAIGYTMEMAHIQKYVNLIPTTLKLQIAMVANLIVTTEHTAMVVVQSTPTVEIMYGEIGLQTRTEHTAEFVNLMKTTTMKMIANTWK